MPFKYVLRSNNLIRRSKDIGEEGLFDNNDLVSKSLVGYRWLASLLCIIGPLSINLL